MNSSRWTFPSALEPDPMRYSGFTSSYEPFSQALKSFDYVLWGSKGKIAWRRKMQTKRQLIDDCLYSAILCSLEQTHCTRLWFYMSDKLFYSALKKKKSTEVVYLQHWHGWCHMKLQPSQRKFCVHHTTMHHVTSCKATYVRCMRV